MPKIIAKLLSGRGKERADQAGVQEKRKVREASGERSEGGKRRTFRKRSGKRAAVAAAFCMLFVVGCLAFTGCHGNAEETKKLEDLEFTVVGEKDTPQALQEMIMQKKMNPFKLTYADGQDMYIVVGKGPQEGGGFSIVVKELYRTENSVVIKTELLGPEKGEDKGTEKSYPVLIVKTGFYEEPVVFQ